MIIVESNFTFYKAKCEDLTTPSNGNITLVTSGTQTTAVYSCGVGYTLDGSSVPTCQQDGTWTTVEHTCGMHNSVI